MNFIMNFIMNCVQVFFLECVKVRIHLVCLDGVLHLLYLPDGRNYVLFGRKKPDVGM